MKYLLICKFIPMWKFVVLKNFVTICNFSSEHAAVSAYTFYQCTISIIIICVNNREASTQGEGCSSDAFTESFNQKSIPPSRTMPPSLSLLMPAATKQRHGCAARNFKFTRTQFTWTVHRSKWCVCSTATAGITHRISFFSF